MGNCKGKAEKSKGKSIVSRQKKKNDLIPFKFYLGLKKRKCLPDRQNKHKGTLERNRCSI